MLYQRWDKINTDLDHRDYLVNYGTPDYVERRGDRGFDTGLPNPDIATADNRRLWLGYYRLDEDYLPIPINDGDRIYGFPLYNTKSREDILKEAMDGKITIYVPGVNASTFLTTEQKRHNQMFFISDELRNRPDIYFALVEDGLIPLQGHLGQNRIELSDHLNRLSRRFYKHTITNLIKGREFYASATAFNRGFPSQNLPALESGRDANMRVFFPGPLARQNMKDIYVVPNPYRGSGSFDGFVEGDLQGDKGRRIWFVNLPMRCNVQIYTLAGDLVYEFEHNGAMTQPILSVSKAAEVGIAASGIHPWNLISRHNQIIASGLYFFSVKCRDSGDVKVGRFAVIR
jgi:hypothetical protein